MKTLQLINKIKAWNVIYLAWNSYFRACLHKGGGPQVGEVTWGGLPHLACKRDYIKMRDYMDRRVTPPKRVTSPTWGTPRPCKQALSRDTFGSLKIGLFSQFCFQDFSVETAQIQNFPSYHCRGVNLVDCNVSCIERNSKRALL